MRLLALPLLALAVSAQAAPETGGEPPAEALVGTLPFEAWREPNRVVVDLAPEGQAPFRMMLDTGAQGSVMTPLMARELGVSVRRNKTTPYRRKTRLGRDLHFWVDTRTSDSGSKTGFEYGLLGGDFLEAFVFEIDFPGRQVRFFDPDEWRVPEAVDAPGEAVVPLRVTARRPFADVRVEGREVRVLVDTGAPLTGGLSGKEAAKLGIDVDTLADEMELGSVLGATRTRFYEAGSFALGPFEWPSYPLLVLPRGAYNLGGSTDSFIGYEALHDFVVRFDYAGRRMWMRRAGPGRVTWLGADYRLGKEMGAMLLPVSGLYAVQRVLAGGAAWEYGIRPGDRIVAPLGEELPSEAEVARRIREGEALTVAREQGGVWVDLELPEAPEADLAPPRP